MQFSSSVRISVTHYNVKCLIFIKNFLSVAREFENIFDGNFLQYVNQVLRSTRKYEFISQKASCAGTVALSAHMGLSLFQAHSISLSVRNGQFNFHLIINSFIFTSHHQSSLFVTIRQYSRLFVTIRHYSSLFVTIHHYSSLFVTIRHYSSLFATICHCSSLVATIRSIRSLFGFYHWPTTADWFQSQLSFPVPAFHVGFFIYSFIIVITSYRFCIKKEKSTHTIYRSGCFHEARKNGLSQLC